MAKLKRLTETGDAFVLGQRLAILQMRMSLGVGAISLKEDYLKIFIKDAWEMVHTLQQQAEELEKEFDVKMEYFAGMRWAGTKWALRKLGRGADGSEISARVFFLFFPSSSSSLDVWNRTPKVQNNEFRTLNFWND